MGMSKSSLYLPVIANAECPGPLLMTVCFLVTLIQLGKAEFDRWWLYTRDGMARLVPMDHLSPAVSTTLFIWGLFDEPREAINQSPRCKMTLLVNSFHLLTRSAKSPPEDIHFAPPPPRRTNHKVNFGCRKVIKVSFHSADGNSHRTWSNLTSEQLLRDHAHSPPGGLLCLLLVVYFNSFTFPKVQV